MSALIMKVLSRALPVALCLVAASCEPPTTKNIPEPHDPPVSPEGYLIIDGRPMPREKVIVFLHIGHSNMAGRTDTPIELRPFNFETHPRLWAYRVTGTWTPAKEPLSGDHYTEGRAGPGMSLL